MFHVPVPQKLTSVTKSRKDGSPQNTIYPHPLLLCKQPSHGDKKESFNVWDQSFCVTNRSMQVLASHIFKTETKTSKSGNVFLAKRLKKLPIFLKKLVSAIRLFKCPKTQKCNESDFVTYLLKFLPMETFGCVQNREKVIQAYMKYFTMTRYDKVDIDCLLGNLSARRIKWLSFTQTHEKSSLIASQRLVHAFFRWLLFEVVSRKVFSVFRTEIDPSKSYKIVYSQKNQVMKFQQKALSFYLKPPMQLYKLIKKKDTEMLLKEKKILGVSKLKFSRKGDGSFRPIVKHGEVCFTKELDIKLSVNANLEKLKQFFSFLRHSSDPAVSNGCSICKGSREDILARKLISYFETVKEPVIYYVKADIQKCYDSVDQERMCNIVNGLFDKMDREKFVYQKLLLLQGKKFSFHGKKGSQKPKVDDYFVRFSKVIRKLSSGVNIKGAKWYEDLDRVCSLGKHCGKDAKVLELRQFEKETICMSDLRRLCLILVKRNVVKLVGSDVYLWQKKGLSQG